jgi:site-specific recombinase XerD
VRRPHPRFDASRNAWVTRAGGRLKILAKGPKTAETETAAWSAFYLHMSQLGNPVAAAPATITLGQLADEFGAWLKQEVDAGRKRQATLNYYTDQIQRFLDVVGGRRPAAGIKPIELERFKTNWQSVQAIQRLYNWGVAMGLVATNPVRSVRAPDLGQRQRILSPTETARLLRAADKHYRAVLVALRHTIARPQEIRALQWKHLVLQPHPMFELTEFKAKSRRTDRLTARRRIPLDDRMLRLLRRLAAMRNPAPDDYVFLNRHGRSWTANALRIRMRNLRTRVGLGPDDRGEQVVNYTFRHTAATRACAAGVRDRVLAEVMGHSRTDTTARYQHLQDDHLHRAIRAANSRMT